MSDSVTTVWGEIQGQEITFPMDVTEMSSATLLFTVPLDAAQALLPGDAFEVIETGPGTAQMVVALVDYIANPWGDYDEVNLGFLARPAGASADVVGSFIYRMPVNQAFTCEAGNKVMGFPKTVERIEFAYEDDTVSVHLWMDGEPTLTVSMPRPATSPGGDSVEAVSYSYLDGVPYATNLLMGMGTGFVDPNDVTITVGTGPVADELRSLGLPTPPDMATWGEGLSATFFEGEPLA